LVKTRTGPIRSSVNALRFSYLRRCSQRSRLPDRSNFGSWQCPAGVIPGLF